MSQGFGTPPQTAQSGSSPDADATTKGLVQLAGDLTGTAASPQIAAGAVGTTELAANAVTAAKVAADVATQAELDAVAAAAQPLDSDLTAIAALSTTSYGRALLALADAAAGRTALGLGTASTQATGAFDASGAAAAAQAASQPLDSDLTAIAALSTTSYGRALLALADAAAGRTALGLGTAAVASLDIDGTLAANSDAVIASQKAVKTYVTANSGGKVTKRITYGLNTPGSNLVQTSYQEVAQRGIVALPVNTTRWRMRIRNWSVANHTAYTGAIHVTGIWLATPSWPTAGRWAGAFASAPTSAIAAFDTASDGSEYTTSWVTDPTLQFTAGQVKGWAMGLTLPNGNSLSLEQGRGFAKTGVGAAAHANDTAALSGAISPYMALDIMLEYECSVPAETSHVLVFGDSISISSGTSECWPHETWPGAASVRNGFLLTNMAIGGVVSSQFTDAAYAAWYSRVDLATTPPDTGLVLIGHNDAANGETAATSEADILAMITKMRTLGVTRILIGTILPDSTLTGPAETVRSAVNTWIRGVPGGSVGVIDFDRWLRDPTTATALPSGDTSDTNTHPNVATLQRMATLVTIGPMPS